MYYNYFRIWNKNQLIFRNIMISLILIASFLLSLFYYFILFFLSYLHHVYYHYFPVWNKKQVVFNKNSDLNRIIFYNY